MRSGLKKSVFFILLAVVLLLSIPAFAAEENTYRQVFGLNPRNVIWFLGQMHLFFGAFVLGVPLFAVLIEIIGWYRKDERFDKLAHEFTGLLGIAYAITAAFGALFSFALFTLYPTLMEYLTGKFRGSMFIYPLFFFAETFLLYLYYYGWKSLSGGNEFSGFIQVLCKVLGFTVTAAGILFLYGMIGPQLRTDTRVFMACLYFFPFGAGLFVVRDKKSFHILAGILLNIFGTAIMQSANSWAAFMMSPGGVSVVGEVTGTYLQVFDNALATPLAIHRMIGNIAFGGAVVGSFAAVKFLGSRTEEEKAHYDWMGYVANFIAIVALLQLPFAGYYLGREIYSISPVMGNEMMGGDFSWTFIIQAMLVGSLFLISNYYLWCGMTRMPGAERYYKYIKFILGLLAISLAVWITPHNLPLSAGEIGLMGGSQYHPTLKYLGLMPAKNAVINLVILSTFFSFLLYRRGNKAGTVPVSSQGILPRIVIPLTGLIAILINGRYALHLLGIVPEEIGLDHGSSGYLKTVAGLLFLNCGVAVVSVFMALRDRGRLAEILYLGFTAFSVVGFLGVYGFVVMDKASSLLRQIAVSQFLQLMSCIIIVSAVDFFLFRGGSELGRFRWGKMTSRSQYALLLLTIIMTMTMGLMGYVRSGLRGGWHVYGVIRDTSEWAYTPTNFTMSWMVALQVFVFLASLAVIFWLGGLGVERGKSEEEA